MTFRNPEYLWFLLVLIPMLVWYIYKHFKTDASLQVSSTNAFDKLPKTKKIWLFHFSFLLRCMAIALLITAIARPQFSNTHRSETTEGIDIMLAVDVSGTMLAEDLKPNRLEAAKSVALEFIAGRPNDNIGLVLFAGESFTQCPLTTDHASLMNLVQSVEYGLIEDGTAIGLGLANAISRIKDSQAKSKVIILITDGTNNRGEIAPLTAAEMAKTFGIRVYTIGVGKMGMAPYPFKTPMGIVYNDIEVDIDDKTLTAIADQTGGDYFRATDTNKLRAIYQEIDKLEKTKLRVNEYNTKSEEFFPFLLGAFIALLLEVILKSTVLRRLP